MLFDNPLVFAIARFLRENKTGPYQNENYYKGNMNGIRVHGYIFC